MKLNSRELNAFIQTHFRWGKTPRQVLIAHFIGAQKQCAIAAKLGISRQYTNNVVKGYGALLQGKGLSMEVGNVMEK